MSALLEWVIIKSKLLGYFVGAAIGAACVASPVRAANLVVDGSFEDPAVSAGGFLSSLLEIRSEQAARGLLSVLVVVMLGSLAGPLSKMAFLFLPRPAISGLT